MYTSAMEIDFDTCYNAVKNRIKDYDGVFYTGVSSTGIFCRPVCPAVTPKPQNCNFYPSAAAALEAGYRPCLRCRPETVPHSPAWNGVQTTVKRALDLIDRGVLDQHGVSDLAARLGVSDRYLRQLFSRYVGASPKAVARSRRVLKAKRLITDSSDSMIDIALKAGFSSVRQFNDTFSKLYGVPPSALRKRSAGTTAKPRKSEIS
jgi:AraC family transcriptional regulator of adaptative response / DNA-3-methyladenine glycosylase II